MADKEPSSLTYRARRGESQHLSNLAVPINYARGLLALVRTVSENTTALEFDHASFEKE